MGIERLKEIVADVAGVLNAVSKFANKGGIFALAPLYGIATSVMKIDWALVKQEIADLSTEERAALEVVFQAELDLVKKDVEAKIEEAVLKLDQAIDLVERVVEAGKRFYQEGKILYLAVRQILGV